MYILTPFNLFILTLNSCSPTAGEETHSLPLTDRGSWALAPLGINARVCSPCRQVQPIAPHFKTSQAVVGSLIHPACSCHIDLMHQYLTGVLMLEKNHSFQGQLKELRGWVSCHEEDFLCFHEFFLFFVAQYLMRKIFYVPKSPRNITLHLCLSHV